MAILTQFGFVGRDFDQGAASFRNYAGQMRYKHPWCAKSNAPTILFLPSFERSLFNVDGVAHLDDVMRQLAMQRFPLSCQSSLCIGVLSPGCLVPLALAKAEAGVFVRGMERANCQAGSLRI